MNPNIVSVISISCYLAAVVSLPHTSKSELVTSPKQALIGDHRIRLTIPKGWKKVGQDPYYRWSKSTVYELKLSDGIHHVDVSIGTYPISRAERKSLFGERTLKTAAGPTGKIRTDRGYGRETWYFALRLPRNTRKDLVRMAVVLGVDMRERPTQKESMPRYVRDLFSSLVILKPR
jgi:hypothetical protein